MSEERKKKSAPEKKIVICISGMAGTGKSTLAKKLAKKYGLKYYSGGDSLKALAAKEGLDSDSIGWWESPEGLGFLAKRVENPKFDKLVDIKLLEFAKKGNVLLDSWTIPWLIDYGFKIWLAASINKRAERIAKRDKIDKSQALKVLKEKEERTKAVYKKLYGFELGKDFKPFNFIIDTEKLDAKEVFNILCMVIENIVLKK